MRLIDLTNKSMNALNPVQVRNLSQIKRIAIHHSATEIGGQMIFENHWQSLGWRMGGYHEIILTNGDVEISYLPSVIVNGVGDHNHDTYHICVVGSFINGRVPSKMQMMSLLQRIRFAMKRFDIDVINVLGHNEFANTNRFNHRSNSCPGMDMNSIRIQLRNTVHENNIGADNKTHSVVAGETLWNIARRYNTTVDELVRVNNIENRDLIKVGQVLNLPVYQ